jgi:hypothetical protein
VELFLISYDKRLGRISEVETFAADDLEQANSRLVEKQMQSAGLKVMLREAPGPDHLRRTHSYFSEMPELVDQLVAYRAA